MSNHCHFNDLPDNIILDIFKYLSVADLIRSQRVCKRWKHLSRDFYLWREVRITPKRISKMTLSKLVNRYFTNTTTSLDLCGAWRWRDLNNTVSVSDFILRKIAEKCPNLKEFKIEEDNLKDVDLTLLPSSIERLSFTNCDIPTRCFARAPSHFASLKTLTLRRCPGFTEKQMLAIGELKSVERLEMYGCYRIRQSEMETIANKFPNLRALSVIGTPFLGNPACEVIASKLPNLEALEIDDWASLTQEGVTLLQNHLHNLKFFSLKSPAVNDGNLLISGSRMHT